MEQQVSTQDSLTKTIQPDSMTSESRHCDKHDLDYIAKIWKRNPVTNRPIEMNHCPQCTIEIEAEQKTEKERKDAYVRQAAINSRLHNAMIAPRFKDKTFENYRPESDGQKKAVETCEWFLENWDKSVGLIFIGGPGTGKNHLACALIKKFVAENVKAALMTEAIKIIRTIKESWRKDGETETQAIKRFIEPDLLVIDELGVQFGSDTEKMYLTEIINDRYNYMKPTILIGNLTPDEIKQIIGERAFDRFREGGKVVVFNWQSHRGKALNR